MNKSIFLVICFSLILFYSCGSSEPKEVIVNDKFKMTLPGSMSETTKLNEDASLQYMNLFQGLYLIVIEDSFDEVNESIIENELEEDVPMNFDGYCQLISFSESDAFLITDDYEELKQETINGLQARTLTNNRHITDSDIYYEVALIQGKETYYQVICWTVSDYEKKHKERMKEIIYSFEEL